MSKFVKISDTVQLKLEDGDWIEVKQRLSYGEEQRLMSSGMNSMRPVKDEYGDSADTQEMIIDMEKFSIDKIFIWGVSWNFTDDNDKPVKFTRAAIGNLDPDVAKEIETLVDAHIEKSTKKKTAT